MIHMMTMVITLSGKDQEGHLLIDEEVILHPREKLLIEEEGEDTLVLTTNKGVRNRDILRVLDPTKTMNRVVIIIHYTEALMLSINCPAHTIPFFFTFLINFKIFILIIFTVICTI